MSLPFALDDTVLLCTFFFFFYFICFSIFKYTSTTHCIRARSETNIPKQVKIGLYYPQKTKKMFTPQFQLCETFIVI